MNAAMNAQPTTPASDGQCNLDSWNTGGASDLVVAEIRTALKESFGLTDSDVDSAFEQARNRMRLAGPRVASAVFGDLSKCKAVKTNKIISAVHAAVTVASLVVLVMLVLARGSAGSLTRTLWLLTLAGIAMTMLQLRHTITLFFKIGWFGFGPNTRAQLVLAGLSTITTLAFIYTRGGAGMHTPLLVVMTGIAAANSYFLVRASVKPEASYVAALTSALNDMLSARKISAVRRFYNTA